MKEITMIIGANGQLGTEIGAALRQLHGADAVICTDLAAPTAALTDKGPYLQLDVTHAKALAEAVNTHKVTHIYHLAALLSASGEKNPDLAWKVNMEGTLNVLNLARENKQIKQIYFPSSIAVFGPNTPIENTPQFSANDPSTMYGITKYTGELLSAYYYAKFGVDVRSLRYPGIISWKTPPGGGTTDYAVDTYHHAVNNEPYTCFLKKDTYLPMMYMPDAIKATFQLMNAPADTFSTRLAYNLTAMSFSPEQQEASIKKYMPDFQMGYDPDFRQAIADSWPNSIDDSLARADWGWKPDFDLDAMSQDMLDNLSKLKHQENHIEAVTS
jgi:nucleoside-diphosphate-sugar epimerase